MGRPSASQALYDPRKGAGAIRLTVLASDPKPIEPSRTNYFAIYWFEAGSGEFWADAARHSFAAGTLLFFTPYQYIRVVPQSAVRGMVIQFHANFLCVETFHAESGCAGTLFGDAFRPPVVALNKPARAEVARLVKRMQQEQQRRSLAFEEMLLAQLKVLLILATRLKAQDADHCASGTRDPRHPVLGPLKQLIDEQYCRLHAPSDYAKLLHMTPKTLGRVVREQLGKSLTDLIRERILTHAKWQLLHTHRPVKEVAREVGFGDELYFSRMFKKATGYSPTFFREFETEIRGGSNLSMLSPPAPILARQRAADNSGS
jgi:AraC family transcriptional regulator, transcriptional activator of pobA